MGLEQVRDVVFIRFRPTGGPETEKAMLWTIALILVVLWILGLVSSTTIGGFIHVLLVLAIIVVLIKLIQGRRLTSS